MIIKRYIPVRYLNLMPFLAVYISFSLITLILLPISAPVSSYIGGYIILLLLATSPYIKFFPCINLYLLVYTSKKLCTLHCSKRLIGTLLILLLAMSTLAVISLYSPSGSINFQGLGGQSYKAYQQNSDQLADRSISIKILANFLFATMVTIQALLVTKYSLLGKRISAVISSLPTTLFSLSIGTFYGVFISLLTLETLIYISVNHPIINGIYSDSSLDKRYYPRLKTGLSAAVFQYINMLIFLTVFMLLFISNQLSRYEVALGEIGICLDILSTICVNPSSFMVHLLGQVQTFTLTSYITVPLLQSGQLITSFFLDLPVFIMNLSDLLLDVDNAKFVYQGINPDNFIANWEPLLFRLSLILTPLISLFILIMLIKTLYLLSFKLASSSCGNYLNPYVTRFLLVFLSAAFLVNDFFLYSVNVSFFFLSALLVSFCHFRLAPINPRGLSL